MATIKLSAAALADLERLQDFAELSGDPITDITDSNDASIGLAVFLLDAMAVLSHQPAIGRRAEQGRRELVISRGRSGYLAKYRVYVDTDQVLILRIRHQREAGYRDDEL
jgi:plasmid stabilization system protein ParE